MNQYSAQNSSTYTPKGGMTTHGMATHGESHGKAMMHSQGHQDLEKLIAAATPTHVAVNNGAWSNPDTWQGGKVPGNGATVLIKSGVRVTYDVLKPTPRIKTIANRGQLQFAVGRHTKLLVETILNAAEGRIDIGSKSRSVDANRTARIVFTSDRGIDTAWDPKQLTKGLVSHGKVNIYGADKRDKVALRGDAIAGSDTLTLKQPPTGWRIGDRIVLAGTKFVGFNTSDADNSRFQDEVLKITAINGNKINFINENITEGDRTVLRFDHTRSTLANAADKLNLHVGNLTRNVSFETENGKKAPVRRRAHVMLMHNPDINVVNAGFRYLGRSDKSRLVDDVGKNVDGSIGRGKNPRGRYSLHLHRTGADDLSGKAAIIRGNAVEGSAGWGIVQHDSHAGLEDNVVFDVVGAGIAAESGNEIGWWTNNLVIKSTGIPRQSAVAQTYDRRRLYDFGVEGDGYWVQGAAQIRNTGNISASANNSGMSLFGGDTDDAKGYFRDVKTIKVSNLPAQLRSLFPAGQTEVDIRDLPMAKVLGFQSYNAKVGLSVWGHKTNRDGELAFTPTPGTTTEGTAHQGRSLIKNFILWGNRRSGAEVAYSSNIDLEDGLILGRAPGQKATGEGVLQHHATFNGTYKKLTVAGFEEGFRVESPNKDKSFVAPTLVGSKFSDNTYNLTKVGGAPANGRPDDVGSFLQQQNNQFEAAERNRSPVARFSHKSLGGLALQLDAQQSSDPDPRRTKDGTSRPLSSKGIAAYSWDLDNDGTPDRFGRKISHVFDRPGKKDVTLTVIDNQGAAHTRKQTLNVQPQAARNPFSNSGFGDASAIQAYWRDNSQYADQGWFFEQGASIKNGVAQLSRPKDGGNFIGQVIRDEYITRGERTLKFRLKNIDGARFKNYWERNQVTVSLWGVNGQFENDGKSGNGPTRVGTLPMNSKQLVKKVYGGKESDFFNWRNISLDVDLGKQGYEYLLVQVNTLKTNGSGDDVAIDNIVLAGKELSTTSAVSAASEVSEVSYDASALYTSEEQGLEEQSLDIQVSEEQTQQEQTQQEQLSSAYPQPKQTETYEALPQPSASRAGSQLPSAIAQLSFEEGAGLTAKDTSSQGNKHHSRLDRAEQWTADRERGSVVSFDGRDDIIGLGNSANLDVSLNMSLNRSAQTEKTISLWFQTEDTTTGDEQVLYEEGSAINGLNLYVEGNQLHFGSWNASTGSQGGEWASTDQIKSGQWHHAALVLEGKDTAQNSALSLYLDGQQVSEMDASNLLKASNQVGIGNVKGTTRFHNGRGLHKDHGLTGSIDEVALFNSALDNSQIQQLASL